MQIYKVDDLSNGLELRKLIVQNKYNYEQIKPFKYITTLEISENLVNTFVPLTKGCDCSTDCAKNTNCECLQCSNEYKIFCDDSCGCSKQNCSKRYHPLACNYQIYFVNPEKHWGLRTLEFIKMESILFEYVGILYEDQESVEFDDYIYLFDYRNKKYNIDAQEKGNLSRFVNHSCSPNCHTELLQFKSDGVPHLFIVSSRNIREGEELTLNYGKPWWCAKMDNSELKCYCNSSNCHYSGKNGSKGNIHKNDNSPKNGHSISMVVMTDIVDDDDDDIQIID